MNLPKKVKVCPIYRNRCWSIESAFKIELDDGWYVIEIFSRRVERTANIVDLAKLKTPIRACYLRGQFIPLSFDVCKKHIGTTKISDVTLLTNVFELDIVHLIPIRDYIFYVRKSQSSPIISLGANEIRNDIELQSRKGATPEEVYVLGCYAVTIVEEKQRIYASSLEGRIKKALSAANAELIDWKPVGDGKVDVGWKFQGHEFLTTIEEKTLQVFDAGLCLAGGDKKHNLSSLPSVVDYAIEEDGLYITRHR